jgi:putative (di)nucleoside polyphosphate hydrolase
VVDAEGFRPNVGIILASTAGRLLWAKRIGMDAWQFPQGGLNPGETADQALYRELHEELGLEAADVQVLGSTREWLRYTLPQRYVRRGRVPLCIGQKQKWFALRLLATDGAVRFDRGAPPEFDRWRWVDYWHPLKEVVPFKRAVYDAALHELEPLVRAPAVAAPAPAVPECAAPAR